jgi:hypothetical protein
VLEVVQLVRVGLVAEHGGAIEISDRIDDALRLALKVEHEYVVLVRVRAVEARQRLHGFDARKCLVHVHPVD